MILVIFHLRKKSTNVGEKDKYNSNHAAIYKNIKILIYQSWHILLPEHLSCYRFDHDRWIGLLITFLYYL